MRYLNGNYLRVRRFLFFLVFFFKYLERRPPLRPKPKKGFSTLLSGRGGADILDATPARAKGFRTLLLNGGHSGIFDATLSSSKAFGTIVLCATDTGG